MKKLITTTTFALTMMLLCLSCEEKEICYECTRVSDAGTHTITNCSDKLQVKIWKEEAEKRNYKCTEK